MLRNIRFRAVLLLLASTLCAGAVAVGAPATAAVSCSGVQVYPGAWTIQRAVSAHGSETTFCLHDGTYGIRTPIVPKSGDAFVGVYSDASRPVIDGGRRPSVKWIINADRAARVKVRNLRVRNAYGPGKAIDKQAGRGIWGGPGLQVTNVRFFGNMQSGIGGGGGGWVITHSQFFGNGSARYLGCCSGAVKSGSHYTVIGSIAMNNIGNGFWCDAGCEGGRWIVKNNVALHNASAGIRYEMSSAGAVIQDNIVKHNNISANGGDGGIAVNSSSNATVYSNTLGGNVKGGIVFVGGRLPLRNNRASHNSLGGDALKGCGSNALCVANTRH
jgi:hypothetical protein